MQRYIKYAIVFVLIFNKTVEQNERNLSLCVLFL